MISLKKELGYFRRMHVEVLAVLKTQETKDMFLAF